MTGLTQKLEERSEKSAEELQQERAKHHQEFKAIMFGS
jgi:hypothetical protein